MPQFILEYSKNIIEKENLKELLQKINYFLTENLPTQLPACKSRACERDVYCVGNGEQKQAFIHASLKILAGRTVEKLNTVGQGLLDILKAYFNQSIENLNLEITLEIRELEKTYFKV